MPSLLLPSSSQAVSNIPTKLSGKRHSFASSPISPIQLLADQTNVTPFPRRSTTTDAENIRYAQNVGSDGKPLGVAPAASIQDGHRPQWISIGNKVDRIVEIISRYIYRNPVGDQFETTGRQALRSLVSRYVADDEKMILVFPAFPFKSPSRTKVLGSLPDMGDELLLRKLEMLARTIEDYHPAGALIRIVSDGIVYGQLLGQSDSTVYRYNEELRRMCAEFSLTHISFVRMVDLISDGPLSDAVMTEKEYVESIPAVRERFLAHVVPDFNLAKKLKEDIGTLNTYRGYLKFLVRDLEGSPLMENADGQLSSKNAQDKVRRLLAKAMLDNGAKFSDLVQRKFPDAIRLSVHAHNNAGPKYAFMMPGGDMSGTPWHNVVKEEVDGALSVGALHSFDPETYEVVRRYGRPYYIRARSAEYDLGEKVNPHVSFVRNQPFGMIIKADPSANLTLDDLRMDKVRVLALRYSVLLLQGFAQSDQETFRRAARAMGEVVYWPKFGDILELKENPNLDMNSSLTSESMPMHYDGVFKTKKDGNGELTHDPPTFQVFRCIQAPEKAEGGKTLITNTAELVRNGLTAEQREWLRGKKYTVFTPANKVFGGDNLKLPLVMHNEKTNHDVLRWHENWPQYATHYKPAEAYINDVSAEESHQIGDYLTDLLYDRRFCYAHTWTTGDLLIADNIELMHTRTAFKPCPRELWRIHVN